MLGCVCLFRLFNCYDVLFLDLGWDAWLAALLTFGLWYVLWLLVSGVGFCFEFEFCRDFLYL